MSELPESYTCVRPLVLPRKDPPLPKADGPLKSDGQEIIQALHQEYGWLDTVKQRYLEIPQSDSNLSWAAYHASKESGQDNLPAITPLLPLFPDDSKSVGMIRHSMDVIKQAVMEVNPGQTPVITVDQPLYTISKQIQWTWPSTYGEDHFVIILGGLYIEMAGLKVIGDWLEDAGWMEALVQSCFSWNCKFISEGISCYKNQTCASSDSKQLIYPTNKV
ncbi:unnamed protein product [Arctogadus glacialis]